MGIIFNNYDIQLNTITNISERSIVYIFKEKASWRKGTSYFAEIKRVCKLESPVFWEDLRKDKFIKTAYFVRNNMQGNIDATEYWHFIYEKIIKRNPEINKILERYSPEKL